MELSKDKAGWCFHEVSLTGNGGVEGARPVMWRVPWWRSVGVLLGLPGLAFLAWVWAGTFSKASLWKSAGYTKTGGMTYSGTIDRELWLNRGMVIFSRGRMLVSPAGSVLEQDPVHFETKMAQMYPVAGLEPLTGLWGVERQMSNRQIFPEMSIRRTTRWVSFGVVVAGYVVVWLGAVMMGRWWMKRRWERERMVEG